MLGGKNEVILLILLKDHFKSTEEKFKNNLSKICQEKCHGNSLQRGLPMFMININCLKYSLIFHDQKCCRNIAVRYKGMKELNCIWKYT